MAKREKINTIIAKVFINCPFDTEYRTLLRPLLFSLIFLNFEPLIASQRTDSSEIRINKIFELIKDSDHSIHDLSRVVAKNSGDSFRLNMPFELGIDWGFKHFNKTEKQFLVLGGEKHSIGKALSDISGCDPEFHENDGEKLVRIVRNWIANLYSTKEFIGASEVWDQYNFFYTSLYENKNNSNEDVESMPVSEYLNNIRKWKNNLHK